ncbi:MAG TPA: enoyl-CoA hydratase/isomerase family protein [Thermomicrobiales bacterium]|nr:enoyl-CoA hydratase/isomerase family protein [Thermomicrobiales bacterium]
MELTRVVWEEADGVGIATLNRPERLNALDLRTIVELDHLVERAANRPAIRCLLVTGNGRGFSAGADVKEWGAGGAESEEDGWVPRMHRLMTRLYHLPKPVIAAVNGVAVGAGCDLALVADLRIASTAARFGEVYVRVGFCPDAGGSFLLPRLIGPTKAAELIFTGRIIDAAEADRLGLLNALVEPDELLPTARDWAARLAAGPTVAIGLAKENIRRNAGLSFEDALLTERRAGALCGQTEDHREGLRATVEKRAPAFQGR